MIYLQVTSSLVGVLNSAFLSDMGPFLHFSTAILKDTEVYYVSKVAYQESLETLCAREVDATVCSEVNDNPSKQVLFVSSPFVNAQKPLDVAESEAL